MKENGVLQVVMNDIVSAQKITIPNETLKLAIVIRMQLNSVFTYRTIIDNLVGVNADFGINENDHYDKKLLTQTTFVLVLILCKSRKIWEIGGLLSVNFEFVF